MPPSLNVLLSNRVNVNVENGARCASCGSFYPGHVCFNAGHVC